MLLDYLRRLTAVETRGDATEGSFYACLQQLLERYAEESGRQGSLATIVPQRTAGCAVDLQVWRHDGRGLVGYVEAKRPGTSLRNLEDSPQMKRYLETFPNLLLTNFYEFRLYRHGKSMACAAVEGGPLLKYYVDHLEEVEGEAAVLALLDRFFDFATPRPGGAAVLAGELAKRTRLLALLIEELLAEDCEGTSGLSGAYQAFAEYLIHGLTRRDFSDLYAQTVAYGLLAARWHAPGDFERRTVLANIPRSNGILRDVFRYLLLEDPRPRIAWIVDDIVDLLADAPVRRILDRYFRDNRGKDPILHFYETFLARYDHELRESRGVYYTPASLVSYVVRSVHELLRTRLGREDGLADGGVTILDPAAGTLTFMVEVFHQAIGAYRRAHGEAGVPALLRDHLLRDCYAFELMMAPYAIAHLKMSLILAEEGHPLGDGERFQLYLTNALDLEDLKQSNFPGMGALSREAREAARVKDEQRITVVLGNPPYSGHSYNRSKFIRDLLKGKGRAPGGSESYYRVDGGPLGERNPKWLQDDYVKFLRFAQWKIEQNGEGVVGFVTNHSYLDNPTFRGMRQSLLRTFDEIYLLDLHGHRKKQEVVPGGGPDENVFEGVEQGVAIALLVKKPGLAKRVFRADLYGTQAEKHLWLAGHYVATTDWEEIAPAGPAYLFAAGDARREREYRRGIPLPEIFPEHSVGVVTSRDAFVLDFDLHELKWRISAFRETAWEDQYFRHSYDLKDKAGWRLREARQRAQGDGKWESRFTEILYRPFDRRHLFLADYLVERTRTQVMRHLLAGPNLGLIVPRQCKEEPGALVTAGVAGHKAVSAYDINYVFPLYLYPPEGLYAGGRLPNLAPGPRRLLARAHGREPAPEEILGYVYAILYSNLYRGKFDLLLRRDFPRLPFPRDRGLFARLARLGCRLVDLHLLRRASLGRLDCRFDGAGGGVLGKTKRVLRDYRPDEGRIYVNEERQYFAGISPEVWAYRIGGYQVLDRWLASRAGRQLGLGELQTFYETVAALERTLAIQRRIDGLYPQIEAGAL